jgi:hypothetical protein
VARTDGQLRVKIEICRVSHVYLRVAVHDLLSNRIGSTEFPLNVKAP